MALRLGELAVILTAEDSKLRKVTERAHTKLVALGKVGALAALAGTATSLAVALAPAVGILATMPAAALGAAAALGTLKLALKGVGAAISAAAGGSTEEFSEALEALPESARRPVADIARTFWNLQPTIQARFFAPLAGSVRGLSHDLRGPLQDGLGQIAGALGRVTAKVVGFVREGQTIGFLKRLFGGVADGIDSASSGVKPLLQGIRDFVAAFVPGFDAVGSRIGSASAALGAWLTKVAKSGQAAGWVDRAKEAFGRLWTIVKNLGIALGGIFKAAKGDANGLVDQLTALTAQFAAWTQSADGQQQLKDLFGTLRQIATDLVTILPGIATVIGGIASVLTSLPAPVQSAVSGFLAWSLVLGLVAGRLGPVFTGIGKLIQGGQAVGRVLQKAGPPVGGFFKALGGHVATGARGFWNMSKTAGSAAKNIATASWEIVKAGGRIALQVGKAAGQVALAAGRMALQFALAAARVVGGWLLMGIQSLISAAQVALAWIIANWPIALIVAAVIGLVILIIANWQRIKDWTVAIFSAVWEWIKGVWDKVVGAFQFVIGWVKQNWPLILGIITGPFGLALFFIWKFRDKLGEAIKTAVGWVKDRFTGMVEWVKGLPGRIGRAASGMWDGIKSAFKSAVNWLIGRWNSFQLTIGGGSVLGVSIPSITLDTPDIPYLAQGGRARSGGPVVVGDAGPELMHLEKGATIEPLGRAADRSRIDRLERFVLAQTARSAPSIDYERQAAAIAAAIGPISVRVDSREIARATVTGQRQLARQG